MKNKVYIIDSIFDRLKKMTNIWQIHGKYFTIVMWYRIRKSGKEVTFETVDQYSDYPENCAWECYSVVSGNTLREVNTVCPFATAFREIGLERAGSLYCQEIDLALNQTLFGNITFKRPQIFTDRKDAPCEMIVTKLD